MSQAAETNSTEIFKELVERLSAQGLPFESVLEEAAKSQEGGDEGIFLEIPPDVDGPGAIVAVNRENVDFKVGGVGPFVLALGEVRRIIAPPEV